MFGLESFEADIEILTITDRIMKAFGAEPKMYTIRINHRKLVDVMMKEYLDLDPIQAQLMTKLFDKKNKISAYEFRDKALEIFNENQVENGLKKIAALVSAKSLHDLPEVIRSHEIFQDIESIWRALDEAKITSLKFDITLMRGLDYYNGMVFEVFDTHPDNNRAMFGGGRYDGLTTLFGAANIPVVGFAPGATTTELFLRSHNLLPIFRSKTDVYMVVIGQEALAGAKKLADNLRQEGVAVECDTTLRKADKQIKTAVKKHIQYLLFVGEDELQEQQYTLKDTLTQQESSLSFERIVSTVKRLDS
jgi:histidyl-tRNA synthetase